MPTAQPCADHSGQRVGTTRRHALYCEKMRCLRVDKTSEAYLAALINTFKGAMSADCVNASILFRRALHVYYRHVSSLLPDPHALADERLKLIQNTYLPRRSRKEQTPHAELAPNSSPTPAYVRAWKSGDEEFLAPILREADKREVMAASGLDALTTLRRAADASIIACSIIESSTGRVVGMFGAVPSPLRDTDGIVWLLGAGALTEPTIARQLIHDSRRFCMAFHDRFSILYTCIDERQGTAIRWLEWLGFTLVKRHEQYGNEQRPFLEYARSKGNV